MKKVIKVLLYLIIAIVIPGFLLPNIFNHREEAAFSREVRLNKAQEYYNKNNIGDAVNIRLSDFYARGSITTAFLGKHYRDMWEEKIDIPVLDLRKGDRKMNFVHVGGGEQTVSVDMVTPDGLTYTLRSVNKDQSRTLPEILQYSIARPLFRDQTAALNPFGALITAELETACNIMHTSPTMYFIPYDSLLEVELIDNLAGRVVLLEKEPGNSWASRFDASEIIKTEDMLLRLKKNTLTVDTQAYLKCRLLDLLISDWDRHGGQWAWLVYYNAGGERICKPLPMDRDMAFYNFDEGFLNRVALAINNKFQSFEPAYGDISGLIKNSKPLDKQLLSGVRKEDFLKQANHIKALLSDSVIYQAFQKYPPPIYKEYGELHTRILKQRMAKLEDAASEFFELIQD